MKVLEYFSNGTTWGHNVMIETEQVGVLCFRLPYAGSSRLPGGDLQAHEQLLAVRRQKQTDFQKAAGGAQRPPQQNHIMRLV